MWKWFFTQLSRWILSWGIWAIAVHPIAVVVHRWAEHASPFWVSTHQAEEDAADNATTAASASASSEVEYVPKELTVCLPGSGVYALFAGGVLSVLQKAAVPHRLQGVRWEGSSSGSATAIFAALGFPMEEARRVWTECEDAELAKDGNLCRLLNPMRQVHAGFRCFPTALRQLIDDASSSTDADAFVRTHLVKGRLSIYCFDWLTCKVVCCNEWRSFEHLTQWALASMTVPFFIPAWPTAVDGMWLGDCMLLEMLHWRKSPRRKYVTINAMRRACTISARRELSVVGALLNKSVAERNDLFAQGIAAGERYARDHVRSHLDSYWANVHAL
jgi:hypothetical protein